MSMPGLLKPRLRRMHRILSGHVESGEVPASSRSLRAVTTFTSNRSAWQSANPRR